MAEVTILWGKIYREITLRAQRGGEAAAELVMKRAKAKAPVRKIFRGTTYRTGKSGFREPTPRRVYANGIQRLGHANSEMPLFRTANRTAFISGDFRAVDVRARQLRKVNSGRKGSFRAGGMVAREAGEQTERELALFTKTAGGKFKLSSPRAVSAEQLRTTGQGGTGPAVTARGRYEIRSGRADFRGTDGVTRVGGRLRASIHVEGPVTEGRVQWWSVVADAKDPKTGRLYGRDQEYGTRHHPPHPFLRPALQESRGAFRQLVYRAVQRGTP